MLDYRQINCILLVLKMIFPFHSPEPKFYCIVQGANGRVTVNLQPPTVNNDDEEDEGEDEDNTCAENDSSCEGFKKCNPPTTSSTVMKSKWIKALKHAKENKN